MRCSAYRLMRTIDSYCFLPLASIAGIGQVDGAQT